MTKFITTNNIPAELIPTIEKIIVDFSYAKVTKNTIISLINNNPKIIELINTNPIKISEVKKLLQKDAIKYSIEYLENTKYEFLLNYINQNCDFSNQKLIITEISKISLLLQKLKLDQNIELLYDIYSNIDIIQECMAKIIKIYAEDLKNNLLFSIINDEVINLFIEFYCEENNIVFEEEPIEINNSQNIYCVSLADEIIKKSYQYKKLTKQETNELILKSQQGNQYATETLINYHQRLVIKIVGKFHDDKNDFEDLYQDGCIGLLKAIEKFDVTRGFAFSTYATWWIKQKINIGKRERYDTIKYPNHIHEKLQLLKKEIGILYNTLGYEPSLSEIIKHLTNTTKLTETEIIETLRLQSGTSSYHEFVDFENTTELIDLIEDENIEDFSNIIGQENVSERFQEIIEKIGLTQRELEIFKCRTGIFATAKQTLELTGDKFGVTRERIRQVESKVIRKIFESDYALEFCNLCEDPELAWKKVLKYRQLKSQNLLPSKRFSAEKLNEFLTSNIDSEEESLSKQLNKTKEELDQIITSFPKRIKDSIAYYYDDNYNPKKVQNNSSFCTKKYLLKMVKKFVNDIENGIQPSYNYQRKNSRQSKPFYELLSLDKDTFEKQLWPHFTKVEKELVLKFYTEDFERNNKKMTSTERYKINNTIIMKYSSELTNEDLKTNKNILYIWFHENSNTFKNLIWPIMLNNEKELVAKYYNENFQRNESEFQNKDHKTLYDIFKKYRDYLESDFDIISNIQKGSLCYLTQLTKEQLDIITNRILTPECIHLIKKYYNEYYERNKNTFENDDLSIIYHFIVRKINIKKNLANIFKVSKIQGDYLYDYFNLNYEEFKTLVWPIITQEDKQVLRTFYTKNFTRNNTPYADDTVKKIIEKLIKKYIFLVQKDIEIIRTLRYENLSNIIPYKEEIIKQFINEENQEIINKYFDQNLCKRKARVNEPDFIHLYYAVSNLKTKLDLANKISNYELIKQLTNQEAAILLLQTKFSYSNQDISNILNINSEIVEDFLNKFLENTEQNLLILLRKRDDKK